MEDFPFESKEDTELAQHYRRLILEELPKQVLVVRGHDKEGHPVYNLMNRTAPKETTNEEGFVVTRLYVMERALAVTEVRSRGRLEKITAIMAYSQLQRGNSPPTDALKKLVVILQNSYTERLRRLIVLAPPTWARVVYNLIYPFLRRETTQKFIMASGKVREEPNTAIKSSSSSSATQQPQRQNNKSLLESLLCPFRLDSDFFLVSFILSEADIQCAIGCYWDGSNLSKLAPRWTTRVTIRCALLCQ